MMALALVFLLDVDNTLLNNDRAKEGIDACVRSLLGAEEAQRFWVIYEQVRAEKGYVDFPTTAARLAAENGRHGPATRLLPMLLSFPFRDYLYPHALETIAYLNRLGEAVVLSDGDPTFQRHKINASGIAHAVDGRVIVVVHKEKELGKVFQRYPAGHYVAVDDKRRIVSALESQCPRTFTTVLVEQGKYSEEPVSGPVPDITVPSVGDLLRISREEFLRPHAVPDSPG